MFLTAALAKEMIETIKRARIGIILNIFMSASLSFWELPNRCCA
jgi:hypothetical protein